LGHRQGHHLLFGLVGLGRRLAPVEIGGEGEESLRRQAVAHRADVLVQAPPLLQHDRGRAAARLGRRQVAGRGRAVARELDVGHLGGLLLLACGPWARARAANTARCWSSPGSERGRDRARCWSSPGTEPRRDLSSACATLYGVGSDTFRPLTSTLKTPLLAR